MIRGKPTFFPHEQTLAKLPKQNPCCRVWDNKAHKYLPTETLCPIGTHDECGCTIEVVHFNPLKPWRAFVRNPESNQMKQFWFLTFTGELARIVKDLPDGQIICTEGYARVACKGFAKMYAKAFCWSVELTTMEAIRSQAMVPWIDNARQASITCAGQTSNESTHALDNHPPVLPRAII